jgi:hypothetical protein
MTQVTKTPAEVRKLPFLLAALIPGGATLLTASGYASRKVSGISTTLQAPSSVEASTLALNADPGGGAKLVVNPAGATEETFKVNSVTGSSPPFLCALSHTAEQAHSAGEPVNYEPGVSSRFLTSTAAAISGSVATLTCQNGADGQIYTVSVLGVLDNGETIELEVEVLVSGLAPTFTATKQVDEVRDLSFNFGASAALANSALQSAVGFVSRDAAVGTTLAALAAIGAPTIQLTANPGVGSLLTVNPSGSNQEKLLVSGISGAGPYVCTVNPSPDFTHSNGEAITYEPGVTSRLFTSATASITGTQAIFRARRGAAGQRYRMTVLATLANTEVVSHTAWLATPEL